MATYFYAYLFICRMSHLAAFAIWEMDEDSWMVREMDECYP